MNRETEETQKVSRRENIIAITVFIIGIVFFLLLVGLPFVVVYLFSISINISVEPEFMSGILAASSILFGLWAVAIGRYNELRTGGAPYSLIHRVYQARTFLVINLSGLIVGVTGIFFSVIGILPSLISLCILVSSFNLNCLLFLLYILFEIEFRRERIDT